MLASLQTLDGVNDLKSVLKCDLWAASNKGTNMVFAAACLFVRGFDFTGNRSVIMLTWRSISERDRLSGISPAFHP